MKPWLALLARELRLALRHPADTLAAVLFFVLVAALFPFGVGPAPETLARLAPGAVHAPQIPQGRPLRWEEATSPPLARR